MADEPPGGDDTIPVFDIDGRYYFKHYFEDTDLYSKLSQFYNSEAYRFEVPEDEFPAIRSFLTSNGKDVETVEEIDDYVVVKEKYTGHPDVLFTESVLKRSHSGYNLFLMKDRTAVRSAITSGAEPVSAKDFSFELD